MPDTGHWSFKGPAGRGGHDRVFTGGKERKAHEIFFNEWDGTVADDKLLIELMVRKFCFQCDKET